MAFGKGRLWLLGLGGAVLGGGLWIQQSHHEGKTSVAPSGDVYATSAPIKPIPEIPPAERREWENRQSAGARLDAFFALERPLSAAQKEEGEALLDLMSSFFERGELVASEALLIQLALLKKVAATEQQRSLRSEALVARYKEKEAQARSAYQPAPGFTEYKSREADVVEEVMTMEVLPAGKTRNELLRERLQALREKIY